MGIGTSIFLIALGAVLRFAVTVSTDGFNINTIGLILMVVGVIGLLISLFLMTAWSSRRGGRVVEERRPVMRERDVY
jgi:sulfite exporter TauE/SafE